LNAFSNGSPPSSRAKGDRSRRLGQWAVLLAQAGHIVLLPDSFGSRGLGSQCSKTERQVTPSGLRRQDAIEAAQWLVVRPGTPPGGVALIGWPNGGKHCARHGASSRGSTARSIPAVRRILSRMSVPG
jgi:dienelactone hydrolase